MPQGVYPTADVCEIGDEISSTYEGRHITLFADNIEHGSGVSYVTKGYPVWFGDAVGIPFGTQAAATNPLIAIDTEGIWCVDVLADNDAGNDAVIPGDALYINTTTNLVSKIRDNATQLPFGYALGNIGAGLTETIAVKVHWDPQSHWVEDQEKFYFGDAYDVSIEWDETDLEILPVADDTGSILVGNGTLSMDVQVFGLTANDYLQYDNQLGRMNLVMTAVPAAGRLAQFNGTVADPAVGDGYSYVNVDITFTGEAADYVRAFGAWLNINGTTAAGGLSLAPCDFGIWVNAGDAGDTSNAHVAYGARLSYIGDANPASLSIWCVNVNGHTVDGIFSVYGGAGITSLGYLADATTDSGKCGDIPIMYDINSDTQYWVRVYDAAS